ncbi:MAG: hypothetical protein PHH01_01185 [Patescibacteria group bacterium]|nr:hypothetical protein [Patescibacteria group bacterium]
MYVRLYFDADGLVAARVGTSKPLHDGTDTLKDWITRAGRFSSCDGEPDVWKYNFDNPGGGLVQDWLDRFGITPIRVEIGEHAYLDDQAIKPWRGRYERGQSTATVDSFIDGNPATDSYPVWGINVSGTSFASAFDLYCRIRSGEEKPSKPWDKIPEEARAS